MTELQSIHDLAVSNGAVCGKSAHVTSDLAPEVAPETPPLGRAESLASDEEQAGDDIEVRGYAAASSPRR